MAHTMRGRGSIEGHLKPTLRLRPCLHCLAGPHPAGGQFDLGLREGRIFPGEPVDVLATHAEHADDLGDADEVVGHLAEGS